MQLVVDSGGYIVAELLRVLNTGVARIVVVANAAGVCDGFKSLLKALEIVGGSGRRNMSYSM